MELCPCGSELAYARCCEPLIEDKIAAETPEQLMRSRYTAFAKKKLDHLLETTIPSARDDHDPDSARQWAEESTWEGLEIIRAEGGEDDLEGVVEFIAQFSQNGAQFKHHELAVFAKEDGRWFFVDGEQVVPKPFTRKTPKTGRNDPCPCNSGKKYKKCCGK